MMIQAVRASAPATNRKAPAVAAPAKPEPQAAKPEPKPEPKGGGFFGSLINGVSSAVGGVIDVVGHVTDKTLDAVGSVVEAGVHVAGKAVSLPLAGVAKVFEWAGAKGVAKGINKVGNGVQKVFDVVGRETHGFAAGVGDAFKGMTDGMKFLIQHPIMAAKGMFNMVRHPSTILTALKAMWAEAREGGWGHAAGYIFGNVAPMLLSGGASEGSWLGRIANSSRLANTAIGRFIATSANKAAHVVDVMRNAARFDIGGVAQAVGDFGKPIPAAQKAFLSMETLRKVGHAVANPIETMKLGAAKLKTAIRSVPAKVKATRVRLGELRDQSKVAWEVLKEGDRPLGKRIVGAQKAFEKAGRTAAEARQAGNLQAMTDRASLYAAKHRMGDAFKALRERKFGDVAEAAIDGVEQTLEVSQVDKVVNGIDKVVNGVDTVINPGGRIEDKLNRSLLGATGANVATNRGELLKQLFRLNQAAVYQGDTQRREDDRENGFLKVINPL